MENNVVCDEKHSTANNEIIRTLTYSRLRGNELKGLFHSFQ